MAGRIRREDIDALKQQADIAAVIGDHTDLKRAGSRLKGLCPFHSEKTPSFTVDPAQGYYHCFGCGEGGDVYSFLMTIQGMDFTEAVEQLARRTGFQLHYEDLSPGQRRALGERSRLVELNQRAMDFFVERLAADEGRVAREYMSERGFGASDLQAFHVGFAPNEWEALSRALVTEGFDRRDLIKVGLSVDNRRGGLRDRFRGRLIFPVLDASGDPIGFGGRILPGLDYGDFEPPKYYNSPETPLYRKARVLYGLPQSRTGMASSDEVLVCEGYTDVMALHQAGVDNAVATCGTAVGSEHFRLLRRYVNRVVLAFDADDAGVKAAERAVTEAAAVDDEADGEPFQLRVLEIGDDRDPADMVRADGVQAVRDAVAAAQPAVAFLVDAVVARADLSTDSSRTVAMREALATLGQEADPDLRRLWARTRIADPLGVSAQWVEQTARRLGVELDRTQGVADVARGRRAQSQRGPVAASSGREAARQRRVLRGALQQPAWLPDEWWELTAEDFTHPMARTLFEALQAAGGAGVPLEAVLEACPDDEVRTVLRGVALEVPDVPDRPASLREEVRAIRDQAIGRELDQLRARTDETSMVSNPEAVRELQLRKFELEMRRRELRAARDEELD